MKFIPYLACLCLLTANAQQNTFEVAQDTLEIKEIKKPKGTFALETVYGLGIPLSTVSKISDDAFVSKTHFGAGLRYMFNQYWGLKTQVSINQFRGNDGLGIDFVGGDLQMVYNLGEALAIPDATNQLLELYLHSGFGAGYSKSIPQNRRERVGQYILGISPRFCLNNTVALLFDFSYVYNLKQHFYFDGTYANENGSYTTGSYMVLAVGIALKL